MEFYDRFIFTLKHPYQETAQDIRLRSIHSNFIENRRIIATK